MSYIERGTYNRFAGASAEYYVASMLLKRGYNVALPALDWGTDIFVVVEPSGKATRVQVKSTFLPPDSTRTVKLSRYYLQQPDDMDFLFAFAIGSPEDNNWLIYFLPKADLYDSLQQRLSTESKSDDLALTLYRSASPTTDTGFVADNLQRTSFASWAGVFRSRFPVTQDVLNEAQNSPAHD